MDTEYVNANEEAFRYLYSLQKSGITNMLGAAPYLSDAMDLPRDEARKILSFWMQNYDEIAKELEIDV